VVWGRGVVEAAVVRRGLVLVVVSARGNGDGVGRGECVVRWRLPVERLVM
jgi:hypothetical protein